MSALAGRIQSALRLMAADGRELVSSPPFTIFVDPDASLPFLTFAIPDAGVARPWSEGAVAALRATFARHDREPRVDVVETCWPGLRDALVGGGFDVEHRLPGLVATPETLRAPGGPPGLVIEAVGRDAAASSIAALLEVKGAAFSDIGAAGPIDAAAIELFRSVGLTSVLGRLADGTPAGCAGYQPAQDGVSEIVAVGVTETSRRQGIGAAVTAAAARSAVRAGAELLFITPDNQPAARVYERVGFAVEPGCELLKLRAPR